MAYNLTPAEIKEICPEIQATDAALNLLITSMNCKLAPCLESSYLSCPDLGRLIFIYFICHIAYVQSNPGQLTSQKWADGDSVSYANYVQGATGLNTTPFGHNVLSLDDQGCVNKTFPNKRVFVTSLGTSGSRRTPFL